MKTSTTWRDSPTANWRELLLTAVMRIGQALQVDRVPLASRLLRPAGTKYPFTDYFKDFEKVEAVRQIFGDQTEAILRNLRVVFTRLPGYMWIDAEDGSLVVSSRYLNSGSRTDIYLDLIHELVHVRQFMEGKQLFDAEFDYADRPTEIEAYQHAVDEARRLGLNDEQICEYLKTEWMSHEELRKLARTLNVRCP